MGFSSWFFPPARLRSRARLPLAATALAMALAMALTACDNPVGGDESHPQGIVLLQNGEEVASYSHGPGGARSGRLIVPADGSVSFQVQLTTAGGDRLPLDGIEYGISDPFILIASFATASHAATDVIVVTGRTPGATTLFVDVDHGTHHEFTAEFDVLVE